MVIQFIGRKQELEFLNKKYKEKRLQFIPIYGRRRVGKTELIKEFIKNKKAIYFLADKGREINQINQFSQTAGEILKDNLLLNNAFNNWQDIITYITNKEPEIIIVIDEFPYLINSNKAIPSIFQKLIDEQLKNNFLILCGSSITMMEKGVLSTKSPLYGRRTGQIKLEPFKLKEAKKFINNYDFEKQITSYSILGGIPLYLKQFNDQKTIQENIEENFLNKFELLNKEAEILLKEEFRESNTYFSILTAISIGKHKLQEIADNIKIERTTLTKYLEELEKLDIIEKITPITENPLKSRKGQYFFKDNYLNFWFRFIYPNKTKIEQEQKKETIKKIMNELPRYTGKIFEKICKELLQEEKTGNYWHKETEIDLITIKETETIITECKWKEQINAEQILSQLKEKTKKLPYKNITYRIMAKNFKQKTNKVKCINLKELEKLT